MGMSPSGIPHATRHRRTRGVAACILPAVIALAIAALSGWRVDATIDLLRELGVDYGQGYHLGQPAALDRTLPYLLRSPASA